MSVITTEGAWGLSQAFGLHGQSGPIEQALREAGLVFYSSLGDGEAPQGGPGGENNERDAEGVARCPAAESDYRALVRHWNPPHHTPAGVRSNELLDGPSDSVSGDESSTRLSDVPRKTAG
jgi:hypothetical protein